VLWFKKQRKSAGESAVVPEKPVETKPAAEEFVLDSSPTIILRDIFSTPETARVMIEIRSDGIVLDNTSDPATHVSMDRLDELQQIDEKIRYHIARKIAVLAPVLAQEEKHFLLLYVIRVLKALANDQVARVRQIISEELRDSAHAPPEIIARLAHDHTLEVASPVLEYSPLLTDYELLDIIASANIPGVTEAIAKRRQLSETVTGAIIDSENETAIYHVLRNPRARISEAGIERVVDLAAPHEHWHEPLVFRPELTLKTVNRIASFISLTLFQQLETREDVPAETLQNLKHAVQSRLQDMKLDRYRSAESEASQLFYQGSLTPELIMERMENGDSEFVIHCLSLRARVPFLAAQRIIESDNPRAVVALCWKAQLAMRDAIQVQLRLAKIHHQNLLNARNGVDYPLEEARMQETLDLFCGN
jgi:uncharacterized protein (DUF2336 family)